MYKKILVPLDGSDLAECVIPHVNTLVSGCGVSEVVFVRVAEPFYVPGSTYIDSSRQLTPASIRDIREDEKRIAIADAEQYLDKIVGKVSYTGVAVRREVLEGPVAEVIADYAEKNSVDLIVICTHGRSGVSRWVWGSVADRILRAACVPVLMIRPPGCVPGI